MKINFSLTITFIFFLNISFGQTTQRGHSSLDRGYYLDGIRVYTKLTKNDSVKILKDLVSKLNGKWTSTEKLTPKEPETTYVWNYQLNDSTFSGYLFNLDIILAAPFVRLKFINGEINIIHSRMIGQAVIDDDTSNIEIVGDKLTIDKMVYSRQKSK